jgi:guanosine-3',5'-bis(diphosphate) 3'-pyrophosphohydrolase
MSLSQLHQAVLFAAERHKGDDTDLGVPYLFHALDVVNNLALAGVIDPTVLTAAALHDVVEHGGVTPNEVGQSFGGEVGALVAELTRTEPEPSTKFHLSKSDLYEVRSKLLLEDIARMSATARRVKLADRLSNLRAALRTKGERKLDRYLLQTRQILALVPAETDPMLWREIDSILAAHSR